VLVDVRVLDAHGHPVPDLVAGDFNVRIGGKTVAVESSTHLFPSQARKRLADALAGYYVLVLEAPHTPPGSHEIDIT
jgi:hypothetical protein